MVEWKNIGEIITRKRTKAKSLKDKPSVYAVTNDRGFVLSSNMHEFTIHSEDTSNYSVVEYNDFAYNPSRLNIGSIAYFKDKEKGLISPMYVVFHADDNLVIPEYLFIVLKSESVRNKIDALKEVGARFRFDFNRWNLIQIPIPSKPEQERIVKILDTFTDSIANLKAQIDARRKQYEYYRDQLLDLEGKEGVEMKTLGEICEFIRGPFGGALKKEMFVKNGYAIYEQQHAIYGDWVFRYFIDDFKFHQMKRFEVKAGDILMSCSGTMGKTSIVPDNATKGIINQALLKLSVKEMAINKYIKMYMDSIWFQKSLSKNTSGGAIQNVASVSILKELQIPIPSKEEQSRIVGILDQFEAIIANLEAQLKAREKQYEYYRNKLLTFE